jgi:hypothetical protein
VRNFTFFCLVFITCLASTFAQTPQQIAVQITATVMDVPPRITLNWSSLPTITQYQIFRKLKSENSWGSVITSIPGTSVQYIDNNVQQNISYEYKIVGSRTNGVNAVGYINAGIKLSETANRGKLFLLIDNRFQNSLAPEIARLEKDLEGEGWIIIKNYYPINASVTDIKNFITQNYFQDPQNTKAVFLLGHIPVPYSGNIYPDGHSDHEGAWPADVFYGDMDGTWTDLFVNLNVASSSRNHNVPGDGKFDQWSIPTDIELQVGRVDLYGLSAFSQSEETLLRNYLNKDHNYRIKQFAPIKRALIDDNFGYFGGEAFSASAMRNFAGLVGTSNIAYTDYISSMQSGSYLWSYGCGGGTYTSANGIGSTNDFRNVTLQGVFSGLFGSYFGDWDVSNALLKSTIANGNVLSTVWSGRPNWVFHHMALGENIGYSARITQNNNGLYASNYGARFIHLALLGDPTLKNDVVSPVSNVIASKNGNNCIITWVPSSDNVIGYNIYSKNQENTTYAKLNSSPITLNNFTDSCLIYPGIYSYMVRAVKLETTASGTYYNLSTGIIDTAANSQNLLIDADFSFNVSNNTVSFIGLINNATNFLWDFDNGLNSTNINPVVNFNDGLYNVKLIVEKSCNSDTIQKMVGVGNLFPAQPGNFISYTDSICAATNNVIFSVPSVANVNYSWSFSGSGATINGSGNSISINFSANASSGNLSVTPSNFYGTGLSRELQIYIKPVPNVTISGENSICSGASTNLIANGASTYLWQGGSTENYITVSPSATTSYNVIGTSSNGCSKASSVSLNVTSTPALPSISILSGSNPFCFGSSVTLRSSSLNGNLWSNGVTTRDVTLDSTNTLTLQVIVNGCSSLVNTITVTEKPSIVSEINGLTNTCEGNTTLTATSNLNYPASISYKWTYPNNSIQFGITQNVSLSGVYLLQVIPSDLCPPQSSSVTVSVSSAVNAQINVSGDTILCQGESVVLTAPSGGSYLWNNGSNLQSITVTQSGNYSVVILSGNCAGASNTVSIQVNPILNPTLTIATPNPVVCNIDIVSFNSFTTFSNLNPIYQWKKNNVNVGSNSSEYIDSLFLNSDVISCEAIFSQGCLSNYSAISNNLSLVVENCGTNWIGGVDNNWSNNLNWSTLEVPSSNTSVRIPNGVLNLPELTDVSFCNNLNILNGMSLFLNDKRLVVSGQILGNGNFVGSNLSELEILGTLNSGSLNFSQSSELSRSLGKLILDCENVSLRSELDLHDELEIRKGIFATNNHLNLKSTSEKTSRIAVVQNLSQSAILGRVKVEKFVQGGYTGWVGLGNPVNSDSIINWMDDFATSGFTGSTGYANGFISVFWYNETVNGPSKFGYVPPIDAFERIRLGRGYMVFFGDGLPYTNDIVYDATGPVHVGDFNFDINYTSSLPQNLGNDDGWNLISNPYYSNIDWDSPFWINSGILNSIYIYDPDQKQYTTYISEGQIGINGGTNLISSNQAFWVKAKSSGAYLVASEEVKTSQTVNFFRNTINQNTIKVKLQNNQSRDETIIAMNEYATNELDDNYDALKLFSPVYGIHNISTKLGSSRLAINSVNLFDLPAEIPLELKVSLPGFYDLKFENVFTPLLLRDNYTLEITQINSDTTFNLFIHDTILFLNKYSILFQDIVTNTNSSFTNKKLDLFPNPSNSCLNFTLTGATEINRFEIVDLFGRLKMNKQIPLSTKNNFSIETELKPGIYFVKYYSLDNCVETKKWVVQY